MISSDMTCVGEALLLLDTDGLVRFANSAAVRLFGGRGIEGRPLSDLIAPADRARLDAVPGELASGSGRASSLRLSLQMDDGCTVPVRACLRVVAGKGVTPWTVVEFHPLHESAEAPEQTVNPGPHLSAEGFHELAGHLREILWVASRDMHHVDYVSPSFERVWGVPVEVLMADPMYWLETVHPEDRPRVDEAVQAPGAGYDLEFRILRPDGEIRWVHTQATPVNDAAGDVVRLCGIAEDITERKTAERELRDRDAVWKAISQTVQALVVLIQDQKIIYVNPYMGEMLGFPTEHFIGMWYWEAAHPDDQPILIDRGTKRVRGEPAENRYTVRLRHSDGSFRYADLATTLVHIDEKPTIMATGFDVTEHRQALTEMERRDAILSAVAEAAAHFLGDVSVEGVMDKVLALLGEATDVSRVYVFSNDIDEDGRRLMSQRHEWCGDGVCPQIDNSELQNLPYTDGLEELEATLGEGRAFHGLVRDLSPGVRDILEPQGIRSIVLVPVFVEGSWWGYIGFDDCARERVWSPAEIDALKVAAGTMAAALERQQAAEALRRSERTFRVLADTVNAAIFLTSDSMITWANRTGREACGYTEGELLRMRPIDLVHEEDRDDVVAWSREVKGGGRRRPLDVRIVRKDGSQMWVEITGAMVELPGETRGLITSYDVTERKRAEEALQQSRQTLSTLIGNLPGATYRLLWRDGDWRLDFISDGIRDLVGVEPDELINNRHRITELLSDEQLERRVRVLGQAIEDRRPFECSYRVRHRDGHEVVVSERGQFVIAEDGTPQFGVGFLVDATREHEIQNQLQHQEKMAAIGLLAAGVAHEIGNPLLGISMAVESLKERLEDDYAQKKLTMVGNHLERIGKIVRQMSDFARRPNAEKGVCQLDDVVGHALGIARFDKRSRDVQIDIDTEDAPVVYASSDQLVQVFLNLALNAFDAMSDVPADRPRRLKVRAWKEGDLARVRFCDTGRGFDVAAARRIFEPFYTTKEVGRGTGLGLSVSFRIVQDHQGVITADGRPGEGACFTVELPVYAPRTESRRIENEIRENRG